MMDRVDGVCAGVVTARLWLLITKKLQRL
jgi:hypothetical protein